MRLFRRHRRSESPAMIKAEDNMRYLRELRKVPVDRKVNAAGLAEARRSLRTRQPVGGDA